MLSMNRRILLAGSLGLPLADATSFAAGQPGRLPDLSLRPTVYTGSERWSLGSRMAHHCVPGVALAVMRDGEVQAVRGFGTRVAGQSMAIGQDTLFSVGSVSKVVTAALCLKLVARGLFNLDSDVNRWLKRWRVPGGPAGDDGIITLRMLLSHTAGLNLHGFEDLSPVAPLPTALQTLGGEPPALNKPLARIDRAGARSRYSGGGYMVIQTLIEDTTGETFAAAAQRHLLGPLGMKRSQFAAALATDTSDVAHAHDARGNAEALPRGWQSFPELAPSGLWTSAGDLARFVLALGACYRAPGGILPKELAVEMMTPVAPGFYGLGPRLAGEGAARIFHHAGANDSYKAYIEGNLASGDGLVVVTNGANGDVLGDEIRNAVSDAFAWPGDWSVRIGPVPAAGLLDRFAGRYRRREGQAPEVAGFLDTGFSADLLEVAKAGGELHLSAKGRQRKLAPVSTNSFVMPDGYIPAGTLLFTFDRGADGLVRRLKLNGGGGELLFDRI